jgi:hypothetical protein
MIGLIFSSGVAQAQATDSCLDQKLVDEIRQSLQLQTADLDKFDRCNPNTNTYKLLEALILAKTITFEQNDLGKPFNQNILPNDFWGYFSQRARVVVDETSCKTGVLAFVYGFAGDGVVHICPESYTDRITKFERAETMLHEVRHFEGYGHVTCTRGPRDGQAGACDDSIDENGSYAVTVESLTKMALKAKNLPRMQRTMVSILALTYANETFNTPIQARDLTAFYLVGNDGKGYIYSDKGLVEVANLGADKVISRTNALAVFPADKSNAYTANVFEPSLDKSPAMGMFSAEYNSLPIASRPEVVDILNLGYLSGSVTAHELKVTLLEEDSDTVVPLQWTAAAVYSGQEYGAADKDSVYVANEAGEMFRVQFAPGHNYQMLPVENTLQAFKSVAVFNGARVALNKSGQVLTEDSGHWVLFPATEKKTFNQMTRPFLWDQYFESNAEQMRAL